MCQSKRSYLQMLIPARPSNWGTLCSFKLSPIQDFPTSWQNYKKVNPVTIVRKYSENLPLTYQNRQSKSKGIEITSLLGVQCQPQPSIPYLFLHSNRKSFIDSKGFGTSWANGRGCRNGPSSSYWTQHAGKTHLGEKESLERRNTWRFGSKPFSTQNVTHFCSPEMSLPVPLSYS